MVDIPSHWLEPRWRIANLYWIQNEHGEKVLFKPRPAQLDFIEQCVGADIILKARQLGFTSLACIIGLDEATFFDNWNVGIIAHLKGEASKIFATKVKFPFDHLPEEIRRSRPVERCTTELLKFKHGSSISVTSSARSGTLQRLHISEMGKICAQMPHKAREVITGSIPAVGKNSVTIESTAEGQSGWFYEKTMDAMAGRGRYKFHFYPWWEDERYVAEPSASRINSSQTRYFDELEVKIGREITPEQRAWYVNMEYDLGGDMKRENPSTPEEAFEAAIEGAYFSNQILFAEKQGNIGRFPFDPTYPVNTFWDLGRNDATTIWFHQHIRGRNRFIDYYENSGEEIGHYINHCKTWAKDRGAQFEDHYWPHDGNRDDLFLEHGRLGTVRKKYNFRPRVVQRPHNKLEAIEAARSVFPSCDFDSARCSVGLKHLREYRKDWDEVRGVWKDRPLHNSASHGADSFMQFATGYTAPEVFMPKPITKEQALKTGRALPYEDDDDDEEDGIIDYNPGSF